MIKTSEWVSIGHPDKVADFISCRILDAFLFKDPQTRFALEVQIKENIVNLGGEITSKAKFSPDMWRWFVQEAITEIGYTDAYQEEWGCGNTISSKKIYVRKRVSLQSSDIAQGVNKDGFGDQGIFWGMAVNTPETGYFPADWYLARKIGTHLYNSRYAGIDIKTQVTMENGNVEEVVVAIPMMKHHSMEHVEELVKSCYPEGANPKLYINGTGRYVKHGPIADCGTTGRKLAVDLYGGNCRIGGGASWGKDGTKADVCLNIYAREKALEYIKEHSDIPEVHCSISCRIGSPEIIVSLLDGQMQEIKSFREKISPQTLIKKYSLDKPIFTNLCKNGLLK